MSKRKIVVVGAVVYVPLTKGLVAVVDIDDLSVVEGYNWFSKIDKRCAYAMRKSVGLDGKRKTLLMHREIAYAPDSMEVDHIDSDGLNNRRINLRVATHEENTRNARVRLDNKSGVKGVHWSSRAQRWMASVRIDGRQVHIGTFRDLDAAVTARKSATDKAHGRFARHE